jgi:hypothetical protein
VLLTQAAAKLLSPKTPISLHMLKPNHWRIKANACIDAGANVALLWIRPEFHSSEQIFSASAQASQFDQCSNSLIPENELQKY